MPAALPPPSSSGKSKALQSYICDLETEKLELQRGLQKQCELVSKLASEQEEASSQFQAVADAKAALERDLKECQAALAVQVRSRSNAELLSLFLRALGSRISFVAVPVRQLICRLAGCRAARVV